ncbi:MAG: sodium:alanine symporter family protein [Myxococcales bacterium]|nr:sodium:alanine symporter family protein [Myxococcales bacterium]
MSAFLESLVNAVWSIWFVVLLAGAGIVFSVITKFVQFRGFWHSVRVIAGTYDRPEDAGEISHFQALSAALSATIGLGNIAGVALAVGAGGPGAVFWMWICGALGMATKFVTCTLSQMYRKVDDDGHVRGGPMYYIELGLGAAWKPAAALFASFCAIASFGGGNMFQANQTAAMLEAYYAVPEWLTGIILVVLVAMVIIGGIKRIGSVAGKIVPFMCVLYIVFSMVIILKNATAVPDLFREIISAAFSGRAAIGGFAGVTLMFALQTGFQRACFSNEAGLGSAPIAHAAAKTEEPVREGIVAMIGPFIDTIVICTMTALVILITGIWRPAPAGVIQSLDQKRGRVQIKLTKGTMVREGLPLGILVDSGRAGLKDSIDLKIRDVDGDTVVAALPEEVMKDAGKRKAALAKLAVGLPVYRRFTGTQGGVELTARAFDQSFHGFGNVLAVAVFLFAFSTMVSWSYYGEQATEYLFGRGAVMPYKIIFCAMIMVGAVINLKDVINFSDAMLGLMAIPNLIAALLLFPRVNRKTSEYFARLRKGDFDVKKG